MQPTSTIDTTDTLGADLPEWEKQIVINNILCGIMLLTEEERKNLLSKYAERNGWNVE